MRQTFNRPLLPLLQEFLSEYEIHLQTLFHALQTLPKGSLFHRQASSGAVWEYRDQNRRVQVSLPEREVATHAAALRLYKEKRTAFLFLRKLANPLQRLLKCYDLSFSEKTLLLLATPVASLPFCTKILPASEPLSIQWPDGIMEISNLPAPHAEQLFYTTLQGEKVRSSAELIIADVLFEAKLFYRYEPAISINGRILRPDFVIASPETHAAVLWEHAGLLNSTTYAAQLAKKKELYASAGFFEGRNLIITYADSNRPISSRQIRRIIQAFFGGEL